jgi:hypothetical protein
MSENNGQPRRIDAAMTARRNSAVKKRARVLETAERIEKLVYGAMSDGEKDGAGYVLTNVPLFVKYNEALSSAIFYKNPKLQVRKREGQGEIAAVRAEVERRKLEYYVHETDLMDNIKLCFAEARPKGTAFVECHFDRVRGHATARWSPFAQTLVDSDTEHSPRVADLMWTGRERAYSLAAAKERFPDYKWHDVYGAPDTDAPERFKVTETGMDRLGGGESEDNKRVRVLTVYMRGTKTASAKDASQLARPSEPEDGTESESEGDYDQSDAPADKPQQAQKSEALYKGGNQVAHYEICSDGLYLIASGKADYVCDDFPLIPLRITVDPREFYAHSMFLPFYDLARQSEAMLRIANTQARKHARTVHLLDEQVFTDEEAATINEGPDHVLLRKKDVMRAANSMQKMDFGEPKQFVQESARMNMEIFRDLSSMDALTLGSPGGGQGVERSATGSMLLDKRAQRLAQKFADEFEAFVARVLRTISQIDRSLMTRAQVQKIVGEDIQVTEEVWPNEWDEKDILGEYDIIIESGSMRYVSEEQKVADMNALVDRWVQFIAQVPDMAQKIGPPATSLLAHRFFRAIQRQAQLMGVPNPEEFLVSAEELLQALNLAPQPAPADMPPEATVNPATPSADTPPLVADPSITPQAIAEMAHAILAGTLDPQSAPPEAQLMASEIAMQGTTTGG